MILHRTEPLRYPLKGIFLVTLFFGSLIFSMGSAAQSSTYDVFWGKDYIGNMDVGREFVEGKTEYEFFVDVRFKILWKNYHRTTRVRAVYLGDTMIYSSYLSIMNDDIKDWTYMERKNDIYKGFVHPDDSVKLDEIINFSSAKLYYEQPKEGLDQIFAEGYTKFCKLENLGNDQYRLYLPGGKENVYTYKNSELLEVLVERTWFNLTFKKTSTNSVKKY
jgi:hypothetical protein